jgi:hypothetical protein
MTEVPYRCNYLTVGEKFNLNHACRMLEASGFDCYQVGSSLTRPNYRDVDVRAIMDDTEYDSFIGDNNTRLKFLNVAVSEWLQARTGLPIDFQFQRQTEANKKFAGGSRNPLGIILGEWVEP